MKMSSTKPYDNYLKCALFYGYLLEVLRDYVFIDFGLCILCLSMCA